MHTQTGQPFVSFHSLLPYAVVDDVDVIAGLPRHWKTLQNRYKNQVMKAHSAREQLKFLKRCREEQVLPKTDLPARLRHLDGMPFDTMEYTILDKAIRDQQRTKNQAYQTLAIRRSELDCIHFYERIIIERHVQRVANNHINRVQSNLQKKLDYLINNSAWTKFSNQNYVLNLSSHTLDEDTKLALGFGLNHCPEGL